MVWISTNACNARCQHCSSASAKRTNDELTTREAFDLVDQLTSFGVLDLAVSGGEPLLRRDLFGVLSHVVRQGMAVGVGSNGGKLTSDQATRLAEAGVGRFQLSLDGPAPAHDRLRCWPGLFDRVLRTIELAMAAGLRVHVCCTINRLNVDELETFASFVAGLGISRLNFSRYVPTGRGTDALDLTPEEWWQVMQRCAMLRQKYRGQLDIVGHLAQQVLLDREAAAQPTFIGCQAGVGQGAVSANGTVYPCVLLPVPVGNLRERAFAEIWNEAPELIALRDRTNLSGSCRECAFSSQCGGCRAVAFAKTGDYLAADPRCVFNHGRPTTDHATMKTRSTLPILEN